MNRRFAFASITILVASIGMASSSSAKTRPVDGTIQCMGLTCKPIRTPDRAQPTSRPCVSSTGTSRDCRRPTSDIPKPPKVVCQSSTGTSRDCVRIPSQP